MVNAITTSRRVAFAPVPVNVQHSAAMAERSVARACIVIPAYQAERTLEGVITDLRTALPALADAIIVVDDGSTDGTGAIATRLGCELVSHGKNRGKGAALVSGLTAAQARAYLVALSVDADGQHPAEAARSVLEAADDPGALVLGIRELVTAGAPRKNQLSNGISNFFISHFAGRALQDTQCGLRRYPVATTLALAARGEGYDFEAEVLLRAVWAGVAVVEEPIRVLYPEDRVTHFHVVRDPWRIVRTVVAALGDKHFGRAT
jgi:glycosyltransferase involved in cell wall biosynthesis